MDTFIKEFNTRYDEVITSLIERAMRRGANPSVSSLITHLHELSKDGKRFRPYAIYSAYNASGGEEDIWDILIAMELLHFFALIHDDVMDRGILRHGVQTTHIYASENYKKLGDTDNEHRGYSQAIILGNIVFSWSIELFNKGLEKISLTKEQKETVREHFLSLIEEVNIGQMIDVDISCFTDTPLTDVLTKNRLKSGNYTFMWPLVIGGTLARSSDETINWLMKLGSALGEAFQAQDDILDTTQGTGKALCQDIESGQQTLITNFLLHHPSHKESFMKYWRRTLTEDEKEEVCSLIESSGAKKHVQDIAEHAFTQARTLLQERSDKEREIFKAICTLVQQRKK